MFQESEIDPPEQITTQTFTNQNFGAHQPHPVPLPPHFASIPNNLTAANHQVPQMQIGNNGIDESLRSEEPIQLGKEAPPANRGPPRPAAANQSYYQNNGYNRPRQNQNRSSSGPRPTAATNRHA